MAPAQSLTDPVYQALRDIAIQVIRVVGVDPLHRGAVEPPRAFARGEEFGRFEMGSTVVLVTPPGFHAPTAAQGATIRMGQPIAELAPDQP